MATRMQQRRGTASQWTTANPVLAAGEIGFETDTGKFKIGDGTNTWSLLKYFLNLDALDIDADGFITDDKRGVANGVASLDSDGTIPTTQLPDEYLTDKINTKIAEVVGAAPATLNTLNEIAAAIDNNADYADTITAALDLKAPKANATFTGTLNVPSVESTDSSTKAASTQFVSQKVSDAKSELNTAITTLNENVDGAITTLNTNVESLTSGLQSANNNAAQLEVSIDGLNTSLNNAQQNITTLQGNDESLQNSVSLLDSRLDSAESSISTLQSETGTLTQSVSEIDGRVDINTGDITSLETSLQGLDTRTTTIESTLDTRLDNHDTSIATLQTNTQSLEGSVTSVTARVNTAEQDIIALETQTGNSNNHIAASLNVHGIANTADLATKSYADNAKTDAISTSATAIALKANIASPALTGTPTAPTAAAGTNTTQIATTAFVKTAVDNVVAAAPGALDTLNELAAALGNDASFSTTMTNALAAKAPSANPTLTGTVALPAASSVTLDGTALSTTLATKADNASVINSMNGSHTLISADVNNIREMSNGGTLSIPSDTSFWPVGAVVDVLQTGSGQVTISGGAGVTVNATPGLKLRAQWSSATILKRAANTFVVMGDLSA